MKICYEVSLLKLLGSQINCLYREAFCIFVTELCSHMCTTADINLTTFMEIHSSQWKDVHTRNTIKE
jgi:hypothetical protein